MTTDTDAPPPPMSVHSQVTASDEAQVGQQVGAQFVSSVLHNAQIYTTSPGDPPKRRAEVARAHLDGGNPRQAEEILASLLAHGHSTTERAYLYVLAVLSDRSFTEITTALSDEIHNAMKLAAGFPQDNWRAALDVVDLLLRYAHAEFGDGRVAPEFTAALEAFGALSADRQDEIDQHLTLILSGAVQERLTSERKHQVTAERMSDDRAGRAWKFFEANPREPLKWLPPPVRCDLADWRAAVLGCLVALSAIWSVLDSRITVITGFGLALIVAAGYLVLRGTTVLQAHTYRADSARAQFQPQPEGQETTFDKVVDQCFRDAGRGGLGEATAGYRGYLKRRLHAQYGDDDVYPGELKWLINWHVQQSSQQLDHRPTRPATHRAATLHIGGAVVGVVGLVFLLAAGHVMVIFLAAGGWWGVLGIARIAAVRRARVLLDDDAATLLGAEWTEYHRWTQVLADRPHDAEMAHWLALDKAFLTHDALRQANLRERDLVTHVVLTERAPFTRKGRVTNGPPRYEAYQVYVFLLTHYGMRTTRTYLRLDTGEVSNEQRQMFPYDAVASASVAEKGRRTFSADGLASTGNFSERIFRLTLVNGNDIAEVKENPRTTGADSSAEVDELVNAVSPPTSGFDSALQILEAVATEGRDWIARDRERKQRWARNWLP